MYKESLENRYYKSLETIILTPSNFDRLITPNSTDKLTALRKDLVDISEEEFGEGEIKSLLDPMYMSRMRHYYLLGKQGVGIAAVQQTFTATSQLDNIYVDPALLTIDIPFARYLGDLSVNLPHNKTVVNDKTYVSLSGIYDKNGDFISDTNSEFINGYVDITKDPFIIQIGATKEMASTYLTLVRMGVPIKTVVYFMNQPIIRTYLKELAANGKTWVLDKKAIDNMKKRYGYNFKYKTGYMSLESPITNTSKINDELKEMLVRAYSEETAEGSNIPGQLTKDDKAKQVYIFDEFLKYYVLSQNIFTLTQGTNYDTASFTDPLAVVFKQVKTNKARTSIVLSSADKLLNASFIGKTKDSIVRAYYAINKIFKTHHNSVLEAFQPVQLELADRLGQNDFFKVAGKVEQAFINSLVFNKTRLSNRIYDLLIDNEINLGKRLDKLIKHDLAGTDIGENLILKQLKSTHEGAKTYDTKNVRLAEKAVEVVTSNAYTEALRELRDNPLTGPTESNPKHSIYSDLIKLAFIQSGVSRSKVSFTEIIPVEDYSRFIIPVLNSLTDGEFLHTFIETNAFYRVNWNDDNIVPVVKNTDYFDIEYGIQRRNFITDGPIHSYLKAAVENHIKTLDPVKDKAQIDMLTTNLKNYRIYKVYPDSRAGKAKFIKVSVIDESIPKEQRTTMARRGDYSFRKWYFLQRIEDEFGEPILFNERFG